MYVTRSLLFLTLVGRSDGGTPMKHARAYSSERQRHGYSWSAAPPKKEIQATEIDLARQYGSGRMQENERSGDDAGGGQEWNPPDARM